MKNFTDHVNENESYKEYTAKFNLQLTIVIEATSEGDAGYEADEAIQEVTAHLEQEGYFVSNHKLLSVDLSAPAQNEQEQKIKPILNDEPEEEISKKVIDIFDIAEKISNKLSVQEKATFYKMLSSKFA